MACGAAHYVKSSNRTYRSETRAKTIISELKKCDVPASPMRGSDSVEDKNEAIFFSVCLS
jgi:hypothetical protein